MELASRVLNMLIAARSLDNRIEMGGIRLGNKNWIRCLGKTRVICGICWIAS